jgi:hypothetical protein
MSARIDPAASPFIGGALALAFLAGAAGYWLVAVPFIFLAGFFLYFFRDPERLDPIRALTTCRSVFRLCLNLAMAPQDVFHAVFDLQLALFDGDFFEFLWL